MRTELAYAEELDRGDPLAGFRERFYVQPGQLYFDGNSLGLLSRDAEAAVLRVLGLSIQVNDRTSLVDDNGRW